MKEFSKKYYDLLNGEYKGINLTRIVDYDEFWVKQILDSIEPLEQSKIFKKTITESSAHIDVGFGGGFPILPLAKKLPKKKFVGVETRGKKARVVGEIAEKLGLSNVRLEHLRIENLLIDSNASVSFKAVGKVYDFLEKIKTTERITVFFYKGPGFYELEKEQIEKSKKDWEIVEQIEIELEGVEKRYLIAFQNKKVLRGTENKTTKNLVKLSELI